MKTFEQPRQLVDNPHFRRDRQVALANLARARIDDPIRGIVAAFADLPCCFTLQSCYGHFVHVEHSPLENLEPLPAHDIGEVRYRIAYIAFCIENSPSGRHLLAALEMVPSIDPNFVQFGSPVWFWDRHLNSYALQVEPSRFQHRDEANVEYREALHIQQVRDLFFTGLSRILEG